MPSIQIDDHTAKALEAIASSHQMSVAEYLAALVSQQPVDARSFVSVDQWQAELDALSIDGPTLPSDFSRADIYVDHD
ncbi:MAG: hypothetical protein U0795_01905 [Pirellulales bacterium]